MTLTLKLAILTTDCLSGADVNVEDVESIVLVWRIEFGANACCRPSDGLLMIIIGLDVVVVTADVVFIIRPPSILSLLDVLGRRSEPTVVAGRARLKMFG